MSGQNCAQRDAESVTDVRPQLELIRLLVQANPRKMIYPLDCEPSTDGVSAAVTCQVPNTAADRSTTGRRPVIDAITWSSAPNQSRCSMPLHDNPDICYPPNV